MAVTSFLKLVSVALVASGVRADNSCSGTLNVTSQSDLDGISSCTSYDGDIQVFNSDANTLSLNEVQSISGDLHMFNCTNLGSFQAQSLQTINGTLKLQALTVLDTLSMPQLAEVNSISFTTLPALQELQFNHGVGDAKHIVISDTQLKSLEGLNLSSVSTFNINNNKNIQNITVDAHSISDQLDISYNAAEVSVSLPYLQWASNATFRFCSDVSIPNLENVTSLSFVNNTMKGLKFPKLESIGGDLELSSNSHLSNITFSNVSKIKGGLTIANNTGLRVVSGFDNLESIGGAVNIVGNFSKASFPKLDEVAGGVIIESSGELNCSAFNSAHKNGDFHGDHYVCTGKQKDVSTQLSVASVATNTDKTGKSGGKGASATASGKGSSESSNGAALVGASGSLVGGLLVLLMELI